MFSTRRICDADAPAAAPAAARFLAGFSSLPQALVRHILALLPVDERARSATVHPSWCDALADPGMWSVLDLSFASGIARSRITSALVRGAFKRAAGQLVSLDLRDCYNVRFKGVLYLVKKSPALRVLRLQRQRKEDGDHTSFHGYGIEELKALLHAAPELQLLHADAQLGWQTCDFDAALQMLRCEGRFTPLRLEHLIANADWTTDDFNATAGGVVELMAAVPNHATLTGMEVWSMPFDEWPAALDAVVTAALASRLTTLVFYESELGPGVAPALVRLLSGTSLTSLRIAYDTDTQQLDEDAAVLLGNALRVNSTLTSLELLKTDLWRVPSAGAALFASLVAHPSLCTFICREDYRCEHEALVGIALHALLAANAPALHHIEAVISGDDGAGPLFDALPRNTHLRSLDFFGFYISHAFARDRLLPAVRANTSLRKLFDEEYIIAQDKDAEQLLFEAFALVSSRGGMRVE
jgi:hypothetical protein